MRRGYDDYAPLTRGRAHWHLLRTARLNLVGWLALAALCAIVGIVAVLLGNTVSWPGPLTAASGAFLALACVVAFDRRRWGGMSTSFWWTDDSAEVRSAVDALRHRGVPVEMLLDPEDGRPHLICRNRDAKRVQALIATLRE